MMSLLHLSSAAVLRAASPVVLRAAATPALTRAFARMADKNDQGISYSVKKSEEEWRSELKPEEYFILREKGTERPGTGQYNKERPSDCNLLASLTRSRGDAH